MKISAPADDAAIFINLFFSFPSSKIKKKKLIPPTERNESCRLRLPIAAGLNKTLPISGMAIDVMKSASLPKNLANVKYVSIAEALITEGLMPDIIAKSQTKHKEQMRHHIFFEKRMKKP